MHVARSLQPADTGSTSNRQPAPGRPSSRVCCATARHRRSGRAAPREPACAVKPPSGVRCGERRCPCPYPGRMRTGRQRLASPGTAHSFSDGSPPLQPAGADAAPACAASRPGMHDAMRAAPSALHDAPNTRPVWRRHGNAGHGVLRRAWSTHRYTAGTSLLQCARPLLFTYMLHITTPLSTTGPEMQICQISMRAERGLMSFPICLSHHIARILRLLCEN
jgi:hypothetical protein